MMAAPYSRTVRLRTARCMGAGTRHFESVVFPLIVVLLIANVPVALEMPPPRAKAPQKVTVCVQPVTCTLFSVMVLLLIVNVPRL